MTLIVFALTLGLAGAYTTGEYAIDWHTIDGGGAGPANASIGGTYALSGTIGQPDARNHPDAMAGGSYTLTGGFWVIPECPAIPADYDGDCDVDQADYALFEACASGPEVPYGSGCASRDLDGDADVDQADFASFQRCLSGEGNRPDVACAGL